MRGKRTSQSGMSLSELMTAAAATAVLMLVAGATWEMSFREISAARSSGESSRHAFSVLRLIREETMRASLIEVPDPGYPSLDSMQLRVPVSGSTVRRAFRRVEGALIVDRKDEGGSPYTAFGGISSLGFTILDPPTNTQVEITCTCSVNGKEFQMQTVARRRN